MLVTDRDLYNQINQEISPLFKFATDKTPNVVASTWRNEEKESEEQKTRTQRIFAHCVSCNAERDYKKYWSEIVENPRGLQIGSNINIFFCSPCEKQYIRIGTKFLRMSPEAASMASDIVNNHLYGPLRSEN